VLVIDLEAAVLRRFTARTPSANDLTDALTAALSLYNRYNPLLVEETFDTVADTQDYDLENIPLLVQQVIWMPGGNYTLLLSVNVAPYYPDMWFYDSYSQYSLYTVNNIEAMASAYRSLGDYVLRDNQIRLLPTPTTSDLEVLVIYQTAHVLTSTDTILATIPDEDFSIMRDLMVADLIQTDGINAATRFDYAEGMSRVTHHYVPTNVETVVTQLRHELVRKYASGGIIR